MARCALRKSCYRLTEDTMTLQANTGTIIVGVTGCNRIVGEHVYHATPARYSLALTTVPNFLPIIVPPIGMHATLLIDHIDGLLLTGSRSNVSPARYGVLEDLTPDLHDLERDETTLGLLRAAIERGIPVLAICRGLQELNVAYGGTLHQRVQDIPGRLDHRGHGETLDVRYGPRHEVTLSGQLMRIIGNQKIQVNSIHQQAIDTPAPNLVVEAYAPDGTIEAVRVKKASAFAFGVQWHPEWDCVSNPDSNAIFTKFREACIEYACSKNTVQEMYCKRPAKSS